MGKTTLTVKDGQTLSERKRMNSPASGIDEEITK